MVIWTSEMSTVLHLLRAKREKKQEKRINTREKQIFSQKVVKWSNKNTNSRSHKINEKIWQKLGRHTSHSVMQLPAKSSLLSQSFAHKINDKID